MNEENVFGMDLQTAKRWAEREHLKQLDDMAQVNEPREEIEIVEEMDEIEEYNAE